MLENKGTYMGEIECMYDSLTGIYNLDTFKECVKKFLDHQEEEAKYALLYTDITHFERVNNLYGMHGRIRF